MSADEVAPSIRVTVCTWDPRHTLVRFAAQDMAIKRGIVAKLMQKHGRGTDAFKTALEDLKLITQRESPDGPMCPECGALMDSVLASEGIQNKLEAYRDVVHDFDRAIQRTRRARS